ncbi:MAG TPA: hypothetical protein VFG04_00015 [Planctomycetaceae bacterium]|jgi:hypothetical protein|nr:hypothetical protein [Planctomycetaceae bacterium]
MSGVNSLLAAQNGNWNWILGAKVLIFVVASLVLSIMRKVAENREKKTRTNTAGKVPPAPAKKDNPFRNEIEAFLEEVGKRRTVGGPGGRPAGDRVANDALLAKTVAPPRIEPPRKPVMLRPVASTERKPEPAKAVAVAPAPATRPGDELASRKAPGSDDLGKQIRTHLSQYLDPSRMTTQAQSDLGNAVERNVRQHLGNTVTVGTADQEQAAQPPSPASAIVPLLRNVSSVRSAIVINEILGPPKGLRRRR